MKARPWSRSASWSTASQSTAPWSLAAVALLLWFGLVGTATAALAPAGGGLAWTQVQPSGAPPARYAAAIAYDAARQEVVLFGGIDPWKGDLNDTWTWDGTTWTQQHPSTSPSPRSWSQMAYDAATQTVLLYGAYTGNDLWSWDGVTWTQLHPATSPPAGRVGWSMAYDAAHSKLVLFGGSDTWTWDGTTWTQQHPTTMPPGRTGARMIYDTALGKVILFGGCCNPATHQGPWFDTWAWDGTTWSQLTPVSYPQPSDQPAMAYDTAAQVIVLYGGGVNGQAVNDTWTWNGAAWAQQHPIPSPPPANAALLAYDTAHQDVVLLSGMPGPDAPPFTTWTLRLPAAPAPRDARYFAQTGYRIDNAVIWNYFQRRGGVPTFGYPTSRTFLFQGFVVQFFQRRIVQLGPDGQARLLNLLDPGLLPYTSFNFSTFPGADSGLVATAPDPTNQSAVLAWVQQHAPNVVAGAQVHFAATFLGTVSAQTAFPAGGDASLLPGIDLEMWGIPTSQPLVDPNNHGFISLRWQRGIMLYDAACGCTQGVLLGDYLKDVLTGQHLPADLAQEAATSPLLRQYDPGVSGWVRNPSLLPNTDLTNAFTPE